MVLEHVGWLDNVVVNADQDHVVLVHASTPSRSSPSGFMPVPSVDV
jgi:hypothetical protein